MAATGKITVSGSVTGGPGGPKTIGPASINSAAAVEDRLSKLLQAGDNSIPVPSGATVVMIIPPDDNTTPLALGAAGAEPIHPSLPYGPKTFPVGAGSFIMNASDTLSALTEFDFM